MYTVTATSPIFMLHKHRYNQDRKLALFFSVKLWKIYLGINYNIVVNLNPEVLFTGLCFTRSKLCEDGLQIGLPATARYFGVFRIMEEELA